MNTPLSSSKSFRSMSAASWFVAAALLTATALSAFPRNEGLLLGGTALIVAILTARWSRDGLQRITD